MKLELDKYGIHLPAFNKIGGILAKELSVDEAAGSHPIGCELVWGCGQSHECSLILGLFSHQPMQL